MSTFPVCDGTLDFSGSSPTCSGTWIASNVQEFDVSQIDAVIVVQAIGAGLIVAGIPLLFILCARFILKPLLGANHEHS